MVYCSREVENVGHSGRGGNAPCRARNERNWCTRRWNSFLLSGLSPGLRVVAALRGGRAIGGSVSPPEGLRRRTRDQGDSCLTWGAVNLEGYL